MKSTKQLFSIAAIFTLILYLASCVPARKFQDMETKMRNKQDSLRIMKSSYKDCREQLEATNSQFSQLQKEVSGLRKDTARLYREYSQLNRMNDNLNELYEKVIAQNKDLLENTSREREKLALELNEKEKELNEKKLELERKENELEGKEADLKQKEENITDLRENLKEREQRVNQLESLIARKDSAVNALRDRMEDALVGFSSNELTIEKRDGKVYISMSDKLLFKLGSTSVDPKGKEALKQVAEVMKKNPDIEIFIEGHTDSLAMKPGGCIDDNWELSVLRATSIVEILVDYGVNPKRLIPSGRSKYFPVASNETKEGRAKNRRTEIILSPKLDKIMNMLESKN